MTIKEFATLCNCSTQTLRYYDRIDLLKPTNVDPWSGYRYYTESQAIDFVKIKNLQSADFTIDEIKQLLTQTDQQVFEAFDRKILEQEQKLAKIRQIQATYLWEKNSMEKLIQGMSDFLVGQLKDFYALKEFGLDPEQVETVVAQLKAYLEKWLADPTLKPQDVTLKLNDQIYQGADQVQEKISSLSELNFNDTILLGNENISQDEGFCPKDFDTVWETQGWEYVRDFINAIPNLESEQEYCLSFHLKEGSYREDISFPLFMFAALIQRKGAMDICMGCSVARSDDGQNHFALLKKR